MMNLPRERRPGVLFGELRTRRHGKHSKGQFTAFWMTFRSEHLAILIDGGWQSVTQNDSEAIVSQLPHVEDSLLRNRLTVTIII